jgi:hypothetical protein
MVAFLEPSDVGDNTTQTVHDAPGEMTDEVELQGFVPLPGSRKNSVLFEPEIFIEFTLRGEVPVLLIVIICSLEVLSRLTTLKFSTGSGEISIVDAE